MKYKGKANLYNIMTTACSSCKVTRALHKEPDQGPQNDKGNQNPDIKHPVNECSIHGNKCIRKKIVNDRWSTCHHE